MPLKSSLLATAVIHGSKSVQIKELWIPLDEETFHENVWRKVFQKICFYVEHCYVHVQRVKKVA